MAARDLVMADVIEFCTSDAVMRRLEEFRQTNCVAFERISESKCPDEEVHDLLFTKLFEEYQALIEDSIETCLRRHDTTIRAFYEECKDIVDGKFTPLFKEHEHKWFIDLLHSWLDYMSFFRMMADEATSMSRK